MRPIYVASKPEIVEATSIYSKSGLMHKWVGFYATALSHADMMRSRCGLVERLSNLDTEGLGHCTKCAKRGYQPRQQQSNQEDAK